MPRTVNRLSKSDKLDLIQHYKNNAATLFANWGISDAGMDHEEAWENTFLTIGVTVGYRSKEHMIRQLKDWLQVLEAKIEKLGQTGEGFLPQLNETERTLHDLMKKLPRKSTVRFFNSFLLTMINILTLVSALQHTAFFINIPSQIEKKILGSNDFKYHTPIMANRSQVITYSLEKDANFSFLLHF